MARPANDPAPEPIDRRAFLGRVAALGAFGVTASALAACGGGGEPVDGAPVVAAASCAGYGALPPEQLQLRQSLGYVDRAPSEASHCENCRFYTAPAGEAPCCGCQIVQGPVSPGGWCRSWAARPA